MSMQATCIYVSLSSPSIAFPLQSTGWSALFFAVSEKDVATTERLLASGANVFLKDKVCSYFYALDFVPKAN